MQDSTRTHTQERANISDQGRADWLVGGGEMGERIRSVDWSRSALGPRQHWPQSLRTIVKVLLRSKVPTVLLWGSEWLVLYNDPCLVGFPDRHSGALGRSWPVVWPELEHLTPALSQVMTLGETRISEDVLLPIQRNGRRTEARFTLTENAVFVEDGTIGGVLVTFHEGTAAVERRRELERARDDEHRILAEFGSVLASFEYEKTLRDLVQITVRSLADYAHLYLFEEGGQARRIASASRDSAHAWCAEILGITHSDKKTAHPTQTTIHTRSPTLQQFDLEKDMHGLVPENLRAALPRSVMGVPLVAGDRCLGALTVWSVSRGYTQRDLELLEELGRRCAWFIENARLHQAEKRATQARDGFLGMVAHDLRNPLAAMILEAGLLQQLAAKSDNATKGAAAAIEESALRMDRIIQDLRDVVRLETGQLLVELSTQPARQLISEMVDAQSGLLAKASLQLRVDLAPELPAIRADRNRLMRVFENLLGNAMKFTKPGGVVTVGAMRREAEVLFRVADTGSGISVSDLPHVFDRFGGVNGHQSRGGELGLAIAKGIIEAHGGRIWVESDPGIGTRFYFTIPAVMGHD